MSKLETKDPPEPTILVPVSLDRLLGIEHRLTRLELGMAIVAAAATISAGGVMYLLADLAAKAIP
jgi:hypothetical protein